MTSQATADQVPRLDPFSQRAGVALRRKDLCVREVPRQHPAQRRKQQPVVRLELRPADLPATNRQLMPEHENLELLRSVTPSEVHHQLEQPAGEDIQRDTSKGDLQQPGPPTLPRDQPPRRLTRPRFCSPRVAESFFATLEKDLLRRRSFPPARRQGPRRRPQRRVVVGPGRRGPPAPAAGTWPCSPGPDLGVGLTATAGHPGSPAAGALAAGLRPASPDRQASAGS